MSEISTRDRYRGCLLGLAAGDALGTTPDRGMYHFRVSEEE